MKETFVIGFVIGSTLGLLVAWLLLEDIKKRYQKLLNIWERGK